MNNISRDNHYLPQMYLKRWSINGKLKEYRLVVSHQNVPLWVLKAVKSAAVQDNLYVRIEDDNEFDDFEHWFDKCYEKPASEALECVCGGKTLTATQKYQLVEYMIAQWVRTPAFYQWSMKLGKKVIPSALDEISKEVSSLRSADLVGYTPKRTLESELTPISIKNTGIKADENSTFLEIETIVGKSTWLAVIKYFLDPDSEVNCFIHSLKWSIVTAPDGYYWPTTDNPFAVSIYNRSKMFTIINDKIGHKRVAILFPISPTKIMIGTQVRWFKHLFTADITLAKEIKKAIVKNAFLYVYSINEDPDIPIIRPRVVNDALYKKNTEEYRTWYQKYKEIEAPLLTSKHKIENL